MIRVMVTTLDDVLKQPDAVQLRDRLNAALDDEALRRQKFYDDLRPGERHEFINGETVLASPQRIEHSDAIENIFIAAREVVRARQLGRVKFDGLMVKLTRNDYHPDVCFWRSEVAATFERGQTVFPPPDFAVEVLSPSSINRDRDLKFDDYAAHGVREYWIVDTDDRTVEQFVLESDAFQLRRKLDAGTLKCEVIEGFMINVESIFASS